MSYVLTNIRKKILGDKIFDKCERGQPTTQEELQSIVDKFNEDLEGSEKLTTSDIINICSFRTKSQIDNAKRKILGNTDIYCQENSIVLPKRDLFRFKLHKLQKMFTDEEFLHLCKTTGWYEESIQIIIRLILYDVNGKVIPGQSEKIINNLKRALLDLQINKADKEKNLTLIDKEHTLYSSFPYGVAKDDFKLLRILWCSPEISQSILFMLGNEKSLIHPCFYSFKVNKSLFLLNSSDMDNTHIFDDVLDQESIRKIKKAYDFDFGNNIHILCVIEAINRIAQTEKTNVSLKIQGYRNRYDQNEIALLDFHKLIDDASIRKGIFEKVVLKGVRYSDSDSYFTYTFPFLHKTFFETYKLKNLFQSNKNDLVDFDEDDFHVFQTYEVNYFGKNRKVYRAACPLAKYDLIYFYEDDKDTKYIFHCSEENTEENDDVVFNDLIEI